MNGRSLPIEINSTDNIDEFIFSPNWSRSFKGGYYELIAHNTIENNNNVINNYTNPNTLNTAGTIIYGIIFAILLLVFLGFFVWLFD